MATFNNSGAYSILNTQKSTYYVQGGHYFSPTTFVDLGTTAPADYQSLSSERSDVVNIVGGVIDNVIIGPNSTIQASVSGSVTNATITNPTLTGGSINGTPIGQGTPAAGAFTGLNATSASILGALSAEGVNSTANGQVASITNTGTAMSSTFAAITYFDAARTANNKTADFLWTGGTFSARFKNDAGSSTVTWLSATGGQASGITGITSNSGSGSWTHTGDLTASGVLSAGIQSSANAVQIVGSSGAADTQIRAVGTAADISIQVTAKGTGSVKLQSPTSVTGTLATTGVVTLSSGFTVASLPAASTALKGARAFVTDAASPTWNSPVTGGSSNTVPVFCNGNAWVCG